MKRVWKVLYVCAIMCSLTGCITNNKNRTADSEEVVVHTPVTSDEERDTGAWESGTVYYNNYKIDITGPKVGHPECGTLWSTYYEDEEETIDVDFYGKEGSLEVRIEELEAEGKDVSEGWLWGNKCQFYIDNATIAMIPLGDDSYLQVEITREEDSLAELTRVSSEFTLIIEKER